MSVSPEEIARLRGLLAEATTYGELADAAAAALPSLLDEIERARKNDAEGWLWCGVALRALGVSDVFSIPNWQEHMDAERLEGANDH